MMGINECERFVMDTDEQNIQKEYFEKIFDCSPNALLIVDKTEKIIFVNDKAAEMFGYEKNEMRNLHINELMPKHYRKNHSTYINSYMQKEIIKKDMGQGRELFALKKNGTEFPVEIGLSPLELDFEVNIMVTVSDITERVEQYERERSLGKILDQSINEIYVFDIETLNFLLVNESARNNLGYSMEELETMTPVDIKPHFTYQLFKDMIQPLKNGDVDRHVFETEHSRKDGTIYPVEIRIQVSKYKSRLAFVATIFDITKRKHAEKEMKKLTGQLLQAQKMEVLGQLTAGIAHDFNNILSSVLGYSELSIESVKNNDRKFLNDYLNNIMLAGKRGRDLISRMLSFSRKNDSTAVITDPLLLIKEAVSLVSASLTDNVTVGQIFQNETDWVKVDPTQLQQAIVNLIINARDAILKRGNIYVELRQEDAAGSICSCCHKKIVGEHILISVIDNGEGIAPSVMPFIFEPFYTTKEADYGTGMGMAMVNNIVHESGGHVVVESEKGIGTVSRIVLPMVEPYVVEDDADIFNNIVNYNNSANILVVDDKSSITDLNRTVLIKKGFNVTTYNDSRDALLKIKENPDFYNLILTDQSMPYLTGLELAEEVYRINSNIPVIILTGYNDSNITEKNNIKKILNKPLPGSILINSIMETLH